MKWIDARIAEAGLSRAYLEDQSGWTSCEFAWALAQSVARDLYPDDAPWNYEHPVWRAYYEAGHASMRREALGPIFYVARAFGSPMGLLRQLPAQVMRLQRGLTVRILEAGSRMAVVAVEPKVHHGFPAAACWNMRGSLEASPSIWGLPPAEVEMVECCHRAGSTDTRCVFRVKTSLRPGADPLLWAGASVVGAAIGGVATTFAPLAGPAVALGALAGSVTLLSMAIFASLRSARRDLAIEAKQLEDAYDTAIRKAESLWEESTRLRRALLASQKLSDYLPADLVEQIVQAPDGEQALGSRTTDAAVLFADLVGFTRRCERMSPQDVVDELNLYFRYIDQAFVQHGGVIDKRMGDGVMGVFVPRADRTVAEARRDAVRCALDLLRALDACNAELQRRGSGPLAARVGVAAGKLVQGTMGSDSRKEYTVIGDVVNLAARLEGQATAGHVMVTTGVWSAFEQPPEGCVVVGRSIIMVKGKSDAIDVVELAPD